jgi:hypothetical protein
MNKQIEIAGKKIFYRVYGNGKQVMLVHEPPQTPPKEGLCSTQIQLSEDADRVENFQLSGFANRSY